MTERFENIERTSIVDSDSGHLEYTYSISGKEISVEYIDSPIATKYIGYDLILSDLDSAGKWISLAYKVIENYGAHRFKHRKDTFLQQLPGDESEILQALFISSITYYGKCFTKADGRRIKLEASNVPSAFLPKHEQFMEFRMTIAAHSGEGPWDTGQLAKIVREKDVEASTVFWSELRMLQFMDDREDDLTYLSLIELLKSNVMKKLSETRNVLLRSKI